VIEMVSPLGEADKNPREVRDPSTDQEVGADRESRAGRHAVIASEHLDPVTAIVLQATPHRTGRGVATIATLAGVDLDTAMRCLGLLAAAGYVERCDQGWRVRRNG